MGCLTGQQSIVYRWLEKKKLAVLLIILRKADNLVDRESAVSIISSR